MKEKRVLPPTYLLTSILAMVGLHLTIPAGRFIPFLWRLSGIAPMGLGLSVAVIADRAFKKCKTTVEPFKVSTSLVRGGVFRISRNPMYLGFVLILIGIGLLMGSVAPFVVVPVFAVLMDVVFIRAEERMLEETFGPEWLDYKKKVRRWI